MEEGEEISDHRKVGHCHDLAWRRRINHEMKHENKPTLGRRNMNSVVTEQ